MADSEEDYERKRRDKFRRERNDYQERRDYRNNNREWEERPRENWRGRGGFNRRDHYRTDFDRKRPRYDSHNDKETSPLGAPPKRFRRDWDDMYNNNNNQAYNQHVQWDYPIASMHAPVLPKFDTENSSILMSYKQYILQLDDKTTIDDSIEKYKKYRIEFQKIAISDFFALHKGEEWFKNKYQPEESVIANNEKINKVKSRLKLCLEFYENGYLEKILLNQDQIKEIVKFMDATIVRLEGGTDEDLKFLEEEYATKIINPEEILDTTNPILHSSEPVVVDTNKKSASVERKKKELATKQPSNGIVMDEDDLEDIDKLDFEMEGDQSFDQPLKETGLKSTPEVKNPNKKSSSSSRSSSCSSTGSSSSSSTASSNTSHSTAKRKVSGKSKTSNEEPNKSPIEEGEAKDDEDKKKTKNEDGTLPLHKTTSIFLRNLPPNVTKVEIENLCKNYKGFLRVALADPLPERKFYRRGWVTFNNDTNIKEISATLASTRVKDCEMGPIVNRDITRRVKLVNGIVVHKPIALNDIRLAIKCVLILDQKYHLWSGKTDDVEVNHIKMNSISNENNDENIDQSSGQVETTTDSQVQAQTSPQEDIKVHHENDGQNNDSLFKIKSLIENSTKESSQIEKILSLIKEILCFYGRDTAQHVPEIQLLKTQILNEVDNSLLRSVIKKLVEHIVSIKAEDKKDIPESKTVEIKNDEPKIENNLSKSQDGDGDKVDNPVDDGDDETSADAKEKTDDSAIPAEEKQVEPSPNTVSNEDSSAVLTVDQIVTLVERDETLCKLLDKLILYLRIVHSLDFYSVTEYPNEDDMPNKFGIIHCRGTLLQDKILSKDVQDWLKSSQAKIDTFLAPPYITLDEAKQLGIREKNAEIEKFVKENTQELSKDKWLCPLSGKKFKGPDFVRKHIFNKHHEKLEIVEKEVDYFNNFLMDSRRPHTFESSSSSTAIGSMVFPNNPSAVGFSAPSGPNSQVGNAGPKVVHTNKAAASAQPPHYMNPYYPYPPMPPGYYPPPVSYAPAGPVVDPGVRSLKQKFIPGQRQVIQYFDFDAPEETEQLF